MTVTPLKTKFGALLKEYLSASGRRQKEMAELLDISSAAVSQVLHGKNTLSKTQLDAVIEWLQLSRTKSIQLASILNQIRNGETQLLSPFNRAFFALRCERGISIPQLAEKTGLSYARLLALEKDQNAVPVYDEAVRLANHLGCTAVDLLRCSGFQPDDVHMIGDPDQVSGVFGGVAESSGAWKSAPIPLLSLKTLSAYDSERSLLEFGCQSAHKLLLQKNEWFGLPVVAIECEAPELALNFPGKVRLIICNKRPENYNVFNLCFTENGKFILQQQSGKKVQVFRSVGTTGDTSAVVWSVPVLELKLLPSSACEAGTV